MSNLFKFLKNLLSVPPEVEPPKPRIIPKTQSTVPKPPPPPPPAPKQKVTPAILPCPKCNALIFKELYEKHLAIPAIQCSYCHEQIPHDDFAEHVKTHTELLPDGQQKDHVTVEPSKRYTGSLEGVPRYYYHGVCRTTTGMPEEIIRSYLVNPFRYSDYTFCAGCGTYVHGKEVRWVQTSNPFVLGETLFEYNEQLKVDFKKKQP